MGKQVEDKVKVIITRSETQDYEYGPEMLDWSKPAEISIEEYQELQRAIGYFNQKNWPNHYSIVMQIDESNGFKKTAQDILDNYKDYMKAANKRIEEEEKKKAVAAEKRKQKQLEKAKKLLEQEGLLNANS